MKQDLATTINFYEGAKTLHDQNISFYEMTRDRNFKRGALLMKTIEVISSDTKDALLAGRTDLVR